MWVEGHREMHFCQMNWDLKDLVSMSLRKMMQENSEMNICKLLGFCDVVIPLIFSTLKIKQSTW